MSDRPKVAVVLVATKDFKGKIVRWASGSEINHAMLVYEDPLWTGFWSAEALLKKGVVRPPFDPDNPRYLRTEFFVYRGDSAIGLRNLRDIMLSDYDHTGAIMGVVRLIFRKLFGTFSNASIHSSDKYFCFEFVIYYLRNLKAEGADRLIPENTSPAILREWLMEHKDFQKVSVGWFMGGGLRIPFAEPSMGR